MTTAGRKISTHTASYDRSIRIPGLSRQQGRWRVLLPSGKDVRFTEASEVAAIERARKLLGIPSPTATTIVSAPLGTILPVTLPNQVTEGQAALRPIGNAIIAAVKQFGITPALDPETPPSEWTARQPMPTAMIWNWVAQQFQADPEYVARMIGAPEGSFRKLALPS